MISRRRAPLLALASFLLGVALMIPFEAAITRLLGVAFLLGAIIGGAFVIAEPDFLSSDEDSNSAR
jgi:hypothetical protein